MNFACCGFKFLRFFYSSFDFSDYPTLGHFWCLLIDTFMFICLSPPVCDLISQKNSLRVEGDNIYVRHSNLMLEDLDKAQEEILKHQASISELKRNFMESTPEPRPNEWEKRRITPLSLQTQGVCH